MGILTREQLGLPRIKMNQYQLGESVLRDIKILGYAPSDIIQNTIGIPEQNLSAEFSNLDEELDEEFPAFSLPKSVSKRFLIKLMNDKLSQSFQNRR